MKKIITIFSLFGIVFSGNSKTTDILKPEWQKKETAVQKLMDGFLQNGIHYDIKIEERFVRYKSEINESRITEYKISFPIDIAEKVHALDKRVKTGLLYDYIDTPEYSFYAAVLMVENLNHFWRSEPKTKIKPEPFIGLIKSDKELWDSNWENIRAEFIKLCGKSDYKNSVLYESIPEIYYSDIFDKKNIIFQTYCSQIYGSNNWNFNEIIQRTSRGHALPSTLACMTFIRNPTLLPYPTINEWENLRKQDTQRFLKICRENEPSEKPYLSALMMGLFTVDGYSFDDEMGVYTMNERGKLLMDYIVEFPIPENATRLQAVMNGGNKDEIEAMMKKHGTEEKWKELLENSVHPEFAKYPPDEK